MRNIFKPKPNTSGPNVFVGLSGGVDSAVSAALLQEQGYGVTGAFIRIVVEGYPCTAGQDRLDAMRVAAHLRIPFVEIDLSREYTEAVFKPTVAEYAEGETPNPDTLCNKEIKFGKFFEFAKSRGADFIATGHYARTKNGELFAGVDPDKDQSYFLWSVPETVLRHTLFPVGAMKKEEVRAYAQKIGLPNAARPDSQGLCFLGPISMGEMLDREVSLAPGPILSETGQVIGSHRGAQRYTLGQRHGFALRAQTSSTIPHYVVGKDAATNTITVSASRYPTHATKTHITLRDTNWIGALENGPYEARFRYRQKLIPAQLQGNEIVLLQPHYAPLGQSLVLYHKERCLGGGVIEKTRLA